MDEWTRRVRDCFTNEGISEIDIAVMPDIIEAIMAVMTKFGEKRYDEGYDAGTIDERRVHFG